MIDVKKTILNTIEDKIGRLMYLADNNHVAFKKIISLIILDDMLDWSTTLDLPQALLKRLMDLRVQYILKNCEFNISLSSDSYYTHVNVDIPDNQWIRLWDLPEDQLSIIEDPITPHQEESEPLTWVPTTGCSTQLIYFGGSIDIYKASTSGYPAINPNELTTCEKMNIYINRDPESSYFGKMYFLDSNGEWQPLKTDSNTTSLPWTSITDRPDTFADAQHVIDGDKLKVNLGKVVKDSETGQWVYEDIETDRLTASEVELTNSDDVEDVF